MNRIEWAKQHRYRCVLPLSTTNIRRLDAESVSMGCCCNGEYQTQQTWTGFLPKLLDSMSRDQPTPACQRCYTEEQQGNQSERIKTLLQMDDRSWQDFTVHGRCRQHEVGIFLSNLCPLACRSCQASESSTYGKITKTTASWTPQQNMVDDATWFDAVTSKLTTVHANYEHPKVHLIGGETLVQPGLDQILDWMINTGISDRFTVAMTTSLAVNLTKAVRDRLQRFAKVELSLSIDSVGDNYHYVRWPSRFNKIEQNLTELQAWRSMLPQLDCSLNPVFSLSNIFYLDDYLDYWLAHPAALEIWPIHLWKPEHLAIENIAPEYQTQLVDYLSSICTHAFFDRGRGQVLLDLITSMMSATMTDSDKMFCYHMVWMADYDRRTGLQLPIYNLRLWNLLTPKHQQLYLDQLQLADTSLPLELSVGATISYPV